MEKIEDLVLEAKKENKLILGSTQTIKKLKLGKVKAVVLSGNANKNVKDDIKHYTELAQVKVYPYVNSKELGTLVGKPFNVSALAIVK